MDGGQLVTSNAPVVRVAVVTDRLEDASATLIAGIRSVLEPAGVMTLTLVNHRQHAGRNRLIARLMRAHLIDAVVFLPLTSATSGHCRLAEVVPLAVGVPAVSVGCRHPDVPYVETAERDSATNVLDHLMLECGRSRPLLVLGGATATEGVVGAAGAEGGGHAASPRSLALQEAASARGVELTVVDELSRCVDRHSAGTAFGRWLADPGNASRMPDSIVCTSDEIAVGVLGALRDHRMRVPEDVALLSYGNTVSSWASEPAISSVEEDLHGQGAAAARHVLSQLQGDDVVTSGPVAEVATGGLVVRVSTLGAITSPLGRAPAALGDAANPAADPGAAWRTSRRVELLELALQRSQGTVVSRLEEMQQHWTPHIVAGELDTHQRAELSAELIDVVSSFPEPLWWRAWLETLGTGIEAYATDWSRTAAARVITLTVQLAVERGLAQGRESRGRAAHMQSQQIVEMNRALVGCTSLVELQRLLSPILPRLGVQRCFVGLLERPGSAGVLGGDHAEWWRGLRLVLQHGVVPPPVAATTDGELWERAPIIAAHELLPDHLQSELAQGMLMAQPLFFGTSWYGFVLYDQTRPDRHVGEALRLAVGQVLDARARTNELTTRSEQLADLVAERTQELETEVASRERAQDELRAANEQLREALLRDGLTGLFNRPALDDHIGRVWRRTTREGRTFSVLMVDVDHFKSFNDHHGHLAGDEALRRVARILRDAADRPDDMVARYGGEEFCIVLADTDLAGAAVVAERVVRRIRGAALRHEGIGEGAGGVVTVSVGVACSHGHLEVSDLVDSADRALYRAKAAGRDVFWLADPGVMTPTPSAGRPGLPGRRPPG